MSCEFGTPRLSKESFIPSQGATENHDVSVQTEDGMVKMAAHCFVENKENVATDSFRNDQSQEDSAV